MAGDCEGVCGERGLHLGVVEVDDGAVVLDHVDLLDAGDRVDRKLLERRLQTENITSSENYERSTEFPIPSCIEVFRISFREFPRLVGRSCS